MDVKKKSFIDAYTKSFGNITQSCKAVEVSRQTYYNWIEQDTEFKAELDAIEPAEVFIDFAENGLVKKIQDGDTTAIIFALKTKGKKRGYVERQEIDHSGRVGITLIEGETDGRDEPIAD
jgi:hypothetical protein